MTEKLVAIVQARTGSQRLPGKVLAPIEGKPLLQHVLERALLIENVDEWVLATTDQPEDDCVEQLVGCLPTRSRISVTRGSTHDVLARYWQAAEATSADYIVRLTADNPLHSPWVASRVIKEFLAITRGPAPRLDYASNLHPATYPLGFATEVFTRRALQQAHLEATRPEDREHVTPYIWQQPEKFRLHNVRGTTDHSALRLTVDTAEDLELVRLIYGALQDRKPEFDYQDIVACLNKHPEWMKINSHIQQAAVPSREGVS